MRDTHSTRELDTDLEMGVEIVSHRLKDAATVRHGKE